jgi:uncharacterized protein (DUF305 family)
MNSKTIPTIAALSIAVIVPAAVAQMQDTDMQKTMQMMSSKPEDSASTKDFKQAHMQMMQNMNMEFSENADIDFARSMIKHHEGGIDMAKIQLEHGKDPEMRKAAEKIINDQTAENKKLSAFLEKNGK